MKPTVHQDREQEVVNNFALSLFLNLAPTWIARDFRFFRRSPYLTFHDEKCRANGMHVQKQTITILYVHDYFILSSPNYVIFWAQIN